MKQLEMEKSFGNKYGLEKLFTKLGFGKIMLLKSNEKKWSNDEWSKIACQRWPCN